MAQPRRLTLRTLFRSFSLRGLFVLVSLFCISLVVWRISIQPYLVQAEAVQRLEELGAKIRTVPAGERWLAKLAGRDRFFDVVEADLVGVADLSTAIDDVANLPQLETFRVGYNFYDSDLQKLQHCVRLQRLFLRNTQITDVGMEVVESFPRLRLIRLGRNITDAGLASLRYKPRLAYVDLSNTQITDAGLQHLRGLPALHKVELNDRPITTRGLNVLATLPKLDELSLAGCRDISDQGFQMLAGWSQLKKLTLTETRISPDSLRKLRESLPQCRIVEEGPRW